MKKGKRCAGRNHRHLLNENDVRRWYGNVANRSRVTADVYLRRLGWFCGVHRLTPMALATMDEDSATNLALDNVAKLQEEGCAGSYVKSIVKSIRSWMKHRKSLGEINVADADETPSLKKDRTPMPEELARIMRVPDLDAKAAASFVSQSGVRLGVLSDNRWEMKATGITKPVAS